MVEGFFILKSNYMVKIDSCEKVESINQQVIVN